ncbi:Rrf2 family transcriptional regulator [soil metagenome]
MISQTAEYAMRAVVFLARNDKKFFSTEQIAKATQVPAAYLSKVLQPLTRQGLVQAQRGPSGGYSLLRSADTITLLEIVNSVDPIKRIEKCPLGLDAHGFELCPLHKELDGAVAAVETAFARTTIDQLVNRKSKVEQSPCDFPSLVDSPSQ